MYMNLIYFASFCDFYIGFLKWSNSVIFFVFLILLPNKKQQKNKTINSILSSVSFAVMV